MHYFILTLLLPLTAFAAEDTLTIKTRIIDCSTYEKAKKYCDEEGLCCDVAEVKKPTEQ